MKKSILLFITLCLLSGCKSNEKESLVIDNYDISVIQSDNCENKLYTTIEEKNIYLKCIDDVIMKKDNNEITLKEYLENNSLETFVKELESKVEPLVYKDGGSKVYKTSDITIVLCKKLVDNDNYLEDIYFGNSELTYDNACL